MLMAMVGVIHPGITALPIISGETVGIERVAGSVVLAVRGRIKLRAVPGILDDGLRSRWTCERRCQQRCAKDCKFCHERPRRVGFSGRRTPRLRACSPGCLHVRSSPRARSRANALHSPRTGQGRIAMSQPCAPPVLPSQVPSSAVCDSGARGGCPSRARAAGEVLARAPRLHDPCHQRPPGRMRS